MKDPRREILTESEKKSLRKYEEKKFIEWSQAVDQLLCRHGFRRVPGSVFDCGQCVDASIEADREFQTHKI